MRHILRALALLALLAACARPAPPPVAAWQLSSIDGAPVTIPFTLGLGRESYSARGPCNAYLGALSRGAGPGLQLDPVETGETACRDLAAERAALDLLARVTSQNVPSGAPALDLVTDTGLTLRFSRLTGGA